MFQLNSFWIPKVPFFFFKLHGSLIFPTLQFQKSASTQSGVRHFERVSVICGYSVTRTLAL